MHWYFASCVPSGGIYHYRTQEGGTLAFVEFVPCDRPMYLLLENHWLYVLLRQPNQNKEQSAVVRFPLGNDGLLGKCEFISSTEGVVACHLCAFQEKLYVANYLSGSLWCSDGTLVAHKGKGKDPERQASPHIHMVTPSPDVRYLLSTDLGLDTIFIYNNQLEEQSHIKAKPGCGPRHLCVLDAEHVACVDELLPQIDLYAYRSGTLHYLETVSTPDGKGAAIRKSGENVYVSCREHGTIAVFRYDGEHLELKQSIASGGDSPRDIVITGHTLYSMNEDSSTVTSFTIDHDGLLRRNQGFLLSIPHVLSLVTLVGGKLA